MTQAKVCLPWVTENIPFMTVSGGNIVMGSKHYIWHLGVCSVHMVTKVQKCFEGDLKVKGWGICVDISCRERTGVLLKMFVCSHRY